MHEKTSKPVFGVYPKNSSGKKNAGIPLRNSMHLLKWYTFWILIMSTVDYFPNIFNLYFLLVNVILQDLWQSVFLFYEATWLRIHHRRGRKATLFWTPWKYPMAALLGSHWHSSQATIVGLRPPIAHHWALGSVAGTASYGVRCLGLLGYRLGVNAPPRRKQEGSPCDRCVGLYPIWGK